jgi:hypothetical protein
VLQAFDPNIDDKIKTYPMPHRTRAWDISKRRPGEKAKGDKDKSKDCTIMYAAGGRNMPGAGCWADSRIPKQPEREHAHTQGCRHLLQLFLRGFLLSVSSECMLVLLDNRLTWLLSLPLASYAEGSLSLDSAETA